MDNQLKLSKLRLRESIVNDNGNLNDIANAFESDRGRVLNSAAIRRLQQKTQVFPLEKNSAVRSRLTHSLEVMQVGRFIVQSICYAGDKPNCPPYAQQALEKYNLASLARLLETTVEMACVLHDVGNPPFGHFGEQAINIWFAKHAQSYFVQHNSVTLSEPEQAIFKDLMHFEGNAQAIRLVHSLMDLNLTNSLVASLLKYTRCGNETLNTHNNPYSYLHKKVGYYYSEKEIIKSVQASLSIAPSHRHPGAYIMEAADDISYCMADLEDAVEKEIINVAQLQQALISEYAALLVAFNLAEKSEANPSDEYAAFKKAFEAEHKNRKINYNDVPNTLKMAFICDGANQAYQNEEIRKQSAFFIKFRVSIVHPLVEHATERFLKNIDEVVNGSLNEALLEDKKYEHALSKALKNVAVKEVFQVKEVEVAELKGYQIIHGLLDKFGLVLSLSAQQFIALCKKGSQQFPLENRLSKRIGVKHLATYLQAIEKLQQTFSDQGIHINLESSEPSNAQAMQQRSKDDISFTLMEYYYRCRLIQDHISGMTDQFALDEYSTLYAL